MRNLPNVYCSYSPGMPVLNGTPGSLLEVYKACLVTGTTKVAFGNIVVANGIAKLTAVTENQVFFNGSTIAIEGCDEPNLNVTVAVESHSTTGFTFKTTVADGTYGGSIKINQPGSGWQILFSGTNEAVFVSGNLDSLGVCIKISDINAYHATVDVYENMSSLTVGVNKLNIPVMFDDNRTLRIVKSGYANATPVHWWLIADNTNVHFSNDRWDASTTQVPFDQFLGGFVFSWGQFQSYTDSDKKNFFITGQRCYTGTSNGSYYSTYNFNIGYYANTTPTDGYCHGAVLTESLRSTRGWMKLYVSTFIAPFTNNSAISGRNSNYKMSMRSRPNFLVADYMFVGHGPTKGTLIDSVILGRPREVKFHNGAVFGQTRNFDIDIIDGKKFINLPIYFYYTTRTYGSIDIASCGMLPFLIGEKWGD